jgi:hypothetical protein
MKSIPIRGDAEESSLLSIIPCDKVKTQRTLSNGDYGRRFSASPYDNNLTRLYTIRKTWRCLGQTPGYELCALRYCSFIGNTVGLTPLRGGCYEKQGYGHR